MGELKFVTKIMIISARWGSSLNEELSLLYQRTIARDKATHIQYNLDEHLCKKEQFAIAWIELTTFHDVLNESYGFLAVEIQSEKSLVFDNVQIKALYQSTLTQIYPVKINGAYWEIQLIYNTGYYNK